MSASNAKALRAVLIASAALGSAVPAAGRAEDESIYSYTRIEADTGKVRRSPGSVQSLNVDGWVGGDINRFWFVFDGQQRRGRTEAAEAQALYGRYIAPFWDFQVGLRHDSRPDSRTYGAIGFRGLEPYSFEVDLKLFVREDGKLLGRTRFENDFLITNRFIVRPYLNAEWSASNLDNTVRSGLYQADLGIQARYEFNRRIAPYVDLSRSFFPRASGGAEKASTLLRAGLRVIF